MDIWMWRRNYYYLLSSPIPTEGGKKTEICTLRVFQALLLKQSFRDLFSIFWINTQSQDSCFLLGLALDIHKMTPGWKGSLAVLFLVRKGVMSTYRS